MAATTKKAKGAPGLGAGGHLAVGAFDITLDTSYPTGGYSITFPELVGSIIAVIAQSPGTHLPLWNYATNKLQLFTLAGAEVANATNVSTVIVRCTVFADVGA